MSEAKRIAIFGGTFDPVHLGHVFMAQRAWEVLELDEVHFLPCRVSPHKQDRQAAAAADRVAMLRLATADLPWATVNEWELGREDVSYSWQTAQHLVATEPEARWFWLMGGDQWSALPRWSRPETLAALVEFIVVARDGETPTPREGWRMHVVAGEHPASATVIRAGAAAGALRDDWLHPDVARFIRERNLYR